MTRHRALLIALVLVVSAVASASIVVAGQDTRVDIDADHDLATQQAVDEYQRDGVVSANLTRIDATLTISDTRDAADIDTFEWDFNNQFVCLDYRDLPQTVRIYIPAEMVAPRPHADLESITDDSTADLEPTANREYTAMTITFDRKTRACFALSKEAGIYFSAKGEGFDIANNSTDWQLPRLGGGESQWQHVETAAFVNNSTVPVKVEQQSVSMQYDATPGENESTWLEVQDCRDIEEQPVCRFTKSNETDTIYLMSTQANPPPVRYKQVRDPLADVQAWAEDLGQVPGRVKEFVDGVFGGDD